jgi:hypothetical protein
VVNSDIQQWIHGGKYLEVDTQQQSDIQQWIHDSKYLEVDTQQQTYSSGYTVADIL